MSTCGWIVLEAESPELRESLWRGRIEHQGRSLLPVAREVIIEGSRRKVVVQLRDPSGAHPSFLIRYWTALRADRAFLVLFAALWVGLLGHGQGWSLNPNQAVVAVTGAFFLHLAVNGIAEIHDGLRLLDLSRWQESGGRRSALVEGWVSPRQLWVVSMTLLAAAGTLGAPLLFRHSEALLPMVAMGALAAWGYSQPPLALRYRGWGELVLFLASGPALVLALSWCFFETWNLSMVCVGACLGFWSLAMHHAGNLVMSDRDQANGVATIVTRLGFLRGRWFLAVFYLLGWVSLLPAVVSANLNPVFVLSLALLLPAQLWLGLRVLRASGSASVWMVGLRRRARRLAWISILGASLLTWMSIQLFGGLT